MHYHIVAVDRNGVIGIKDKLPFNVPEDLKHFKKISTEFETIVIGFNTFLSILNNYTKGEFLPGRKVIVLCHDPLVQVNEYGHLENVSFAPLQFLNRLPANSKPPLIAGGATVYKISNPAVVFVTEVDVDALEGLEIENESDIYKYSDFNRLKTCRRIEGDWLTSETGIKYRHVTCYL